MDIFLLKLMLLMWFFEGESFSFSLKGFLLYFWFIPLFSAYFIIWFVSLIYLFLLSVSYYHPIPKLHLRTYMLLYEGSTRAFVSNVKRFSKTFEDINKKPFTIFWRGFYITIQYLQIENQQPGGWTGNGVS